MWQHGVLSDTDIQKVQTPTIAQIYLVNKLPDIDNFIMSVGVF